MDQIELAGIGSVLDRYTGLNEIQVECVQFLAHNISIPRTAELVKIPPEKIQSWIRTDEEFRAAVTEAQKSIAANHKTMLDTATFLGGRQILSILSQDYESASQSERREIARTARYVLDLSRSLQENNVQINTNVYAPSVQVSPTSVDAIARRIREIDAQGEPVVIASNFSVATSPRTHACHAETDFGALNYNEITEEYQCHICGKWFTNVFAHAQRIHGVEEESYREMYGL